jgi:Family of unknown function (DUF6529)
VNPAHRWSGRLAFVCTLPVAYRCIFKLGFRSPDMRVVLHSLFGCAVYGGYAAKVTIVRLRRFPVPVLPVAGGLLFAFLIAVWYTSALWLYTQSPAAAPGGLDALRPSYEQVRAKVEQGGGVMPSFRDMLSPQQIRDVAAFVATRAGSP